MTSAPAPRVRLFVTDVDGTLTDGAMYYGPDGEVMKRFHTRDGMGLARLMERGVQVAFMTREDSPIVTRRAEKLGIRLVLMGVKDKVAAMRDLARRVGVPLDAVAYVGDDLNDVDVMRIVGLSFAVADAVPEVAGVATVRLSKRGGEGAVREAADQVLEDEAGRNHRNRRESGRQPPTRPDERVGRGTESESTR